MHDNLFILLFGFILCLWPAAYIIKLAIKAKKFKEALKYFGGALFLLCLAGIFGYVVYADIKENRLIKSSIETYQDTKDAAKSLVMLNSYLASDANEVMSKIIKEYPFGADGLVIAILEKYGNKPIAEKLLNSSNLKLQEAAKNWASSRGYTIEKREIIKTWF